MSGPPVRKTRVNHEIRLSPIRVIDQNDKMLGEMPTDKARQLAEAAGLDLVEINPETRPPLCKITDYGKYKYEISKKSKPGPKNKSQEMKEVRLGRSMKIDDHDVEIRKNQARKFLMQGHKVQMVLRFRGREMAHKDLGLQKLREITKELSDISKVEVPPRAAGRQVNLILAPDKVKIEAIKRKEAAAKAKADAQKKAQPADAEEPTETQDTAASNADEGHEVENETRTPEHAASE